MSSKLFVTKKKINKVYILNCFKRNIIRRLRGLLNRVCRRVGTYYYYYI